VTPCASHGTGCITEDIQPEEADMPEFMDVHRDMKGITPEALKAAHDADLAIQEEEGVVFKQAWADPDAGLVWCLSEGPSAEAVMRIHERAGHPTGEVHPVPVQT
jgi:hypothetical protein